MKNLTEKMKNNSAAVLVPNPGERFSTENISSFYNRKYLIFLLAAARAESLFFDSVPVDKIGEISWGEEWLRFSFYFCSDQELRTRGWAIWSTSGVIWSVGPRSDLTRFNSNNRHTVAEAGNEFGTTSPYGAALIRVGQTEKKWVAIVLLKGWSI